LGSRKGIRPVKRTEWWDSGMVICLGQGADSHMAQLMPLPLTISCSRNPDWFYLLVLPFWYWLTSVVPNKVQVGRKMVVVVVVVVYRLNIKS